MDNRSGGGDDRRFSHGDDRGARGDDCGSWDGSWHQYDDGGAGCAGSDGPSQVWHTQCGLMLM